jgi:hypothetical protein
MTEADPYVHNLSKGDVDEARELASRGLQRLRDISETTTTLFNFTVSYDVHVAKVEVEVRLVTYQQSQHSPQASYDLLVSYHCCCDDTRTEEALKREIQLVYDTCIRPIRRRLDDSWYETTLTASCPPPANQGRCVRCPRPVNHFPSCLR